MLTASMHAWHAPYQPTTDTHHHRVDAWGEAVSVLVFGWCPVDESASTEQGRTTVVSKVDILAPPGTTGAHRDKWILNEVEYQQVGGVKDLTHGPFGYKPGVVIRVERVDG